MAHFSLFPPMRLSIFLGAGCSKEEPKTQTQKENKQAAETVETVKSAEKTRAILKAAQCDIPCPHAYRRKVAEIVALLKYLNGEIPAEYIKKRLF